jgi:hypothetical protein
MLQQQLLHCRPWPLEGARRRWWGALPLLLRTLHLEPIDRLTDRYMD